MPQQLLHLGVKFHPSFPLIEGNRGAGAWENRGWERAGSGRTGGGKRDLYEGGK